MGGLGLVHSLYRAHRAVVPAIARLLLISIFVRFSTISANGLWTNSEALILSTCRCLAAC